MKLCYFLYTNSASYCDIMTSFHLRAWKLLPCRATLFFFVTHIFPPPPLQKPISVGTQMTPRASMCNSYTPWIFIICELILCPNIGIIGTVITIKPMFSMHVENHSFSVAFASDHKLMCVCVLRLE